MVRQMYVAHPWPLVLVIFIHIVQHLREEVIGCSHLLQELSVKVREQDQELSSVRKEVALLLSEIGQTKHILQN